MLVQFRSLDRNIWRCNTVLGRWEQYEPNADFENTVPTPLASGKLIPQTMGVYVLQGIAPPNPTSIGIMFDGVGDELSVYLRPSVDVTDFTMPEPFTKIRYRTISAAPPRVQTISRQIRMKK